jgi:hypothetical protein
MDRILGDSILIEVDLGQRAVERCDIVVYLNEKIIGNYFDMSYGDLPDIANELRAKYPNACLETWCLGEDCTGGTHRWEINTNRQSLA